jgi:hypothetical protein
VGVIRTVMTRNCCFLFLMGRRSARGEVSGAESRGAPSYKEGKGEAGRERDH